GARAVCGRSAWAMWCTSVPETERTGSSVHRRTSPLSTGCSPSFMITVMAIADRYLADDEELVHVARQHWTVLVGEFVALLLILAIVGTALWFLPWDQEWSMLVGAGGAVSGVIAALAFCLVPRLKWSTTGYALRHQQ